MPAHREDDAVTGTDGPVDLAAVRADDAMLDAACRGSGLVSGYGRSHDDERLADLLAAWRAEVEAEPVPELVTLDEAIAAIREGRHVRDRPGRARPAERGGRRRVPWGLAVAAGAAVAVLGLGTAVHQSAPGEPLWGVTQVVFSSKAADVQRQYDARSDLERADSAIAEGDLDAARGLLRSADSRIAPADPADAADSADRSLREQRDRLSSSLAPAAVPPAPAAPAPSGAAVDTGAPTDTSTTTTTTTTPPTTTTTVPRGAGVAGASGTPGASTGG